MSLIGIDLLATYLSSTLGQVYKEKDTAPTWGVLARGEVEIQHEAACDKRATYKSTIPRAMQRGCQSEQQMGSKTASLHRTRWGKPGAQDMKFKETLTLGPV